MFLSWCSSRGCMFNGSFDEVKLFGCVSEEEVQDILNHFNFIIVKWNKAVSCWNQVPPLVFKPNYEDLFCLHWSKSNINSVCPDKMNKGHKKQHLLWQSWKTTGWICRSSYRTHTDICWRPISPGEYCRDFIFIFFSGVEREKWSASLRHRQSYKLEMVYLKMKEKPLRGRKNM